MRSKCINSTSGRESVTGNGSATQISYMTWKVSPSDAAFSLFWRFFTAHAQFRPHYYFQLKSDVIFEFSAPVFQYRRGHFGRATLFSATFVRIMSAHAQYINSTSGRVSLKMDSATSISYGTWKL